MGALAAYSACEQIILLARRVQPTIIEVVPSTDNRQPTTSLCTFPITSTAATSYLLTGQRPPVDGLLRSDWPNIGAVLAKLGRGKDPLPPFVQMRPKMPGDVPRFVEESHGQFGGWLGPTWDPLTIDARPDLP